MQTRNHRTTNPADRAHHVIRRHALPFAAQLDLGTLHDDALHLVHAGGRGSCVRVPAGWVSLCLPLAGRLQLASRDSSWELAPWRMQVWRDGELRLGCRGSGSWLALGGPLTAWARLMPLAGQHADAGVFPRESDCPRTLRRLMVRLARRLRAPAAVPDDPQPLLESVCMALIEQQRDLHARLQRCSGRTLLRRQQTLLRLLRVRHLIERNADDRIALAQLARSASYSPWHLIRMHRDVFDQTPSEYAARLRLDRAWTLVRDTRMPICEITEALGFESQSSFCRAFKSAYGTTTGEVRADGAATGSPPRARHAAEDARAA